MSKDSISGFFANTVMIYPLLKTGSFQAMSEKLGYAGMSYRKNTGVRIQSLYNHEFIKMNVQHRTSNVQCRMKTKAQYQLQY